MKFIRFIQFVFLLAFCQHIEAQTITGYVFDAKDGEPIIGASVLNGKNGCMTDFDGKFVISGKPGDKLTFKAFGCSDKKVAAQNNMEVGMGKGSYTKMKRAAAATSSTSRNSSSSSSSSSSSKSSTSSEPCYVKSEKTEKDGFKWAWYYDISVSAKWIGAMDANGNILIPATKHFTLVRYRSVKDHKGFFYVQTEDDKEGVYDLAGHEIIAPKYKSIIFSEYENCFKYEKGDDFVSLPITLDSNGRGVRVSSSRTASSSYSSSSTSSSSSTYSSSSSSSYSSSSQYGNLLFQGIFTTTGVGRNSSAYSSCGQTSLSNYAVYENALIIDNGTKVMTYTGNVTVYGVSGRKYGNDQMFYLVSGIDMLSFVVNLGNDVTVLYLEKGDTRNNYNGKIWSTPIGNGGNNYNNGGNFNNYNNNSNQRQPICKTCYGRKLCRNCNGTKLVANAYTGRNEFCEVCHRTGLCPTCNGTGVSPFRH